MEAAQDSAIIPHMENDRTFPWYSKLSIAVQAFSSGQRTSFSGFAWRSRSIVSKAEFSFGGVDGDAQTGSCRCARWIEGPDSGTVIRVD